MARWWLVTWTTYASWLPGDPRGFQTWRGKEYIPPPRRYAKPSEQTYSPENYRLRYEAAKKLSEAKVVLNDSQRNSVISSLVDEIESLKLVSAVLAVGGNHVHWLACFGTLPIRMVVGRLKARATRDLNRNGFEGKRPWTKNCHMVSKDTPEKLRTAFNYVLRHRDEDCLIHAWLSLEELLAMQ